MTLRCQDLPLLFALFLLARNLTQLTSPLMVVASSSVMQFPSAARVCSTSARLQNRGTLTHLSSIVVQGTDERCRWTDRGMRTPATNLQVLMHILTPRGNLPLVGCRNHELVLHDLSHGTCVLLTWPAPLKVHDLLPCALRDLCSCYDVTSPCKVLDLLSSYLCDLSSWIYGVRGTTSRQVQINSGGYS